MAGTNCFECLTGTETEKQGIGMVLFVEEILTRTLVQLSMPIFMYDRGGEYVVKTLGEVGVP